MNKRLNILIMLYLVVTLAATNILLYSRNYAYAASTIKLSSKSITLEPGKSKTLELIGTGGYVTWKSGNKSVATVSANGKVTAKKVGTTTITATVNQKKYTCKVIVKAKIETYLKNAPFDAVIHSAGKLSFVIPENWYFRLIEETDEDGKPNSYYLITIAPDEDQTSYINVSYRITGEKAEDYKSLKSRLSKDFTAASIEEMMEAAYNTEATVTGFIAEDFDTDLCTAFRTEYALTLDEQTQDFYTYDFSIDNYYFSVTANTTDDTDIDSVAQYFLRSIVISN